MLYFLTWTYQRGALISLHICKRKSAFKWNKRHETRNRKYGFGVFGVYSRSLSFQLVNYCRPQIEGDFPFIGRAAFCCSRFLYLLKGWKKTTLRLIFFIPFVAVGLWLQKKTNLAVDLFYTLCRGWLVDTKKSPTYVELFLYLKKVEKKDPSFDESFLYPLSRLACGYKKRTNFSAGSFIPPSGFEPLLREWKSRVLGH